MPSAQPETDLPMMPAPRDSRCPLAPPPEFARWRESDGLQKVSWNGKPTWLISRYDDIRAALVDARLSANTMNFSYYFWRCSGDLRAHRRSRAPSLAPHDDPRFHLPAR